MRGVHGGGAMKVSCNHCGKYAEVPDEKERFNWAIGHMREYCRLQEAEREDYLRGRADERADTIRALKQVASELRDIGDLPCNIAALTLEDAVEHLEKGDHVKVAEEARRERVMSDCQACVNGVARYCYDCTKKDARDAFQSMSNIVAPPTMTSEERAVLEAAETWWASIPERLHESFNPTARDLLFAIARMLKARGEKT